MRFSHEMTRDDHILTCRDLHKSFGSGQARVHVLRGVSLSVRRGEFLAVMGPSGCGKSTLLHVLGLMTPPDRGSIVIDGSEVGHEPQHRNSIRRRQIGFVFQRFNLISVLSAADNIAVSLKVRGVQGDGHVGRLMEALGVVHVAARKPGQMSIGEQQRIAVVRALAHQPAILLADEPTGSLDSDNSRSLLEVFRDLNRNQGQTIVMITHSQQAADYAGRVVRMKDGLVLDESA